MLVKFYKDTIASFTLENLTPSSDYVMAYHQTVCVIYFNLDLYLDFIALTVENAMYTSRWL